MINQRQFAAVFAALLTVVPAIALAQEGRSVYATRDSLRVRAIDAERIAANESVQPDVREEKRGEAYAIRYRLEHGDFRAGDRIVVTTVIAQQALDTLIVAADQTVELKGFPSVSLRGTLRSELEDRLLAHLREYVREPRVTAKPLVRLSVMGRVARPGFYNVPAEALMSDVIMIAGGPAADADLSRTVVRRDNEEIWAPTAVATALSDGFTVDGFDLRPGDELVVGTQRRTNWESLLRSTSVVVGLVSIFFSVR